MKDPKQRAEQMKGKKPGTRLSKSRPPRTVEEYSSRGHRFQEVWNRITQVISRMRGNKISLQKASRELGVDPRTVVRRGGSALRKSANGRFAAKSSDRFLRVLVFPTHDGTREIALRGSRLASELGEYWAAVQKYLQTGDGSGLKKFRGKNIRDANGEPILFITDRTELNRLGSAGVFSFESIYARVA